MSSDPHYTSRVFGAARECKARLAAQTWPSNPVTGAYPQIAFTDPDPNGRGEIIQIIPDVGDDASIVWARMPGGRDEQFDLVIRLDVSSRIDEDEMLDRLEALADVVQRAFFDDTTATILPLDVDGAVRIEGVGQVSFVIVEAPSDGLRGICEIRYRLAFRI